MIFELPNLSIFDITGGDAGAVLNNLTTNAVLNLSEDQFCETFVTDVRGKTLGFFHVIRRADGFRLIGAEGQSEQTIAHIDRYIIREDAVLTVRDNDLASIYGTPDFAKEVVSSGPADAHSLNWLNDGGCVIIGERSVINLICQNADVSKQNVDAFHHARTLAGFPWYGIEIDQSNLPQEIGRDDSAISFTKGCYLGQETVARLDALGKVQRKLVRWSISGSIPAPGAKLECNGKLVGRLTSVAATGDGTATAIGFARRTHFDAGTTAESESFKAIVL